MVLPAKLLASYGQYHRHPKNRLTHYFGVPLIIVAIAVAASTCAMFSVAGYVITLATILASAYVCFYMVLDRLIGMAAAAAIVALVYLANVIAGDMPATKLWLTSATLFVIGWAFQLLGHHIEGNRPALLDNLFHIVVAPFYLMARVVFAAGLKKELRVEVQALIAKAE